MTAKIISGREVAEHILEQELAKKVDETNNSISVLISLNIFF